MMGLGWGGGGFVGLLVRRQASEVLGGDVGDKWCCLRLQRGGEPFR